MNYSARIAKLQKLLIEKELDALFVTDQINIEYLTGFSGVSNEEKEATLLITDEDVIIFIPKMYEMEAEASKLKIQDLKFKIVERGVGLFGEPKVLFEYIEKVGFEAESLSFAEYRSLESDKYNLVPITGLVESLRLYKDPEELELIRKAVEITDLVWEALRRAHGDIVGKSEIEVARFIRDLMEQNGADGMSFDPVVAFGANSALPHYKPSDVKINEGILLIDMGAKYKGYCGDLTRMFYFGDKDELYEERYELLLTAQQITLEKIKPGIKISDLIQITLDELGLEQDNFIQFHSLGHGVGLQIHEGPFMRLTSDQVLEPGMMITVEPGLYYPGWGGMRIEDLCIVTESGVEVVSKSAK